MMLIYYYWQFCDLLDSEVMEILDNKIEGKLHVKAVKSEIRGY